jgi:hypothetical protein
VGFIYLPFHLLLLFFGAGSFFIFLFYWHRPSRVNRIESVKETDAFSNREAQREREREALWLIFRDWGHCRPRSLLLLFVWSRRMEMELFQPLNSTNQELSSLERRKGKISLLIKSKRKRRKYGVVFYSISLPTIWCDWEPLCVFARESARSYD